MVTKHLSHEKAIYNYITIHLLSLNLYKTQYLNLRQDEPFFIIKMNFSYNQNIMERQKLSTKEPIKQWNRVRLNQSAVRKKKRTFRPLRNDLLFERRDSHRWTVLAGTYVGAICESELEFYPIFNSHLSIFSSETRIFLRIKKKRETRWFKGCVSLSSRT